MHCPNEFQQGQQNSDNSSEQRHRDHQQPDRDLANLQKTMSILSLDAPSKTAEGTAKSQRYVSPEEKPTNLDVSVNQYSQRQTPASLRRKARTCALYLTRWHLAN